MEYRSGEEWSSEDQVVARSMPMRGDMWPQSQPLAVPARTTRRDCCQCPPIERSSASMADLVTRQSLFLLTTWLAH